MPSWYGETGHRGRSIRPPPEQLSQYLLPHEHWKTFRSYFAPNSETVLPQLGQALNCSMLIFVFLSLCWVLFWWWSTVGKCAIARWTGLAKQVVLRTSKVSRAAWAMQLDLWHVITPAVNVRMRIRAIASSACDHPGDCRSRRECELFAFLEDGAAMWAAPKVRWTW